MKHLRFFAYCLIATLAVALTVEGLAAFYYRFKPEPERYYQHSYLTGYDYDAYFGFRTHDFPYYGQAKDIGQRTLVITGGSTAMGVGVAQSEKRYYTVLEKLFKGEITNVVNFAVPGFVSNQESAVYANRIYSASQAPAAVVSLTSFNDCYFYLFRSLEIGRHEFDFAMNVIFKKGYPEPSNFAERLRNSVRRTHVYSLYHQLRGDHNPTSPIMLSSEINDTSGPVLPDPVSDERIERVAENFVNNVLRTAILAKAKGTKYVVVLQPNYYFGGELSVVDNEWFRDMQKLKAWIEDCGRQRAAYAKFYELVSAKLSAHKKESGLYLLDYRALLKDAGPVYLDPVHFNARASQFLAETLYKDLKRIL